MSNPRTRLLPLAGALALAAAAFAPLAQAAEEVSLYTTREPKLIQPLIDAFTKQSGVKVNTVFVKDGLLERV
ncbi:iron ABC transporter substrate-binding protein, partial [Burkholderia cenocepacia]|nr:iron ABC transporter substrate-binding protein [Burkholderia cenocepacia]